MRQIAILGSTGSIGEQTIEVCLEQGITVRGLACGKRVKRLVEQIQLLRPKLVSVADPADLEELKARLRECDLAEKEQPICLSGEEGAMAVAAMDGIDMVMAAIVGMAGLRPTLAAIEAGHDVALANKEALVVGGELVLRRCAEKAVALYPVDSEHSAIWQCLWGQDSTAVKKIWLTASGGPFRQSSLEELQNVTVEQALQHPTWAMGGKISIDSATLMNKGLEWIEAMHLFDLTPEQIEVLVHPQSVIHSMVEFQDSGLLAQLGFPDMKLPIRLALCYPKRPEARESRAFDPFTAQTAQLSFERPDLKKFRLLGLAQEASKQKKSLAIVMNAANEVAVSAFLNKRLSFLGIADVVEHCMELHQKEGLSGTTSIEEILFFDQWARRVAEGTLLRGKID